MIKRKKGKCKECDNEVEVELFRSSPKECIFHYQKNKKAKYLERQKNKPKKKRVVIKNFSKKKAKQLKEYRKKRDNYLAKNKYCEVIECGNRSTNLHHKGGRVGILLNYAPWFMACCSSCHPNKIHFTRNKWAIEKGYLKTGAEIDKKLKELKK